MTYIQPTRKSTLSKILFMIIAIAVLAALAVVILHNNIVNLEYTILRMRDELKDIEAKNIELKENIFSLFDAKNFSGILGTNLIQDKNPEYLEVGHLGAPADESATPTISRL